HCERIRNAKYKGVTTLRRRNTLRQENYIQSTRLLQYDYLYKMLKCQKIILLNNERPTKDSLSPRAPLAPAKAGGQR
ncbi:MAG: hypothetical protein LBJ73_02875, partial [Rickettsiales bacterium]|nr:hypothetical protein [Rickettsiales bacterium]